MFCLIGFVQQCYINPAPIDLSINTWTITGHRLEFKILSSPIHHATCAHYVLALFAVLFPLLATGLAGTEQNDASGWKPVVDISDRLVIDIGKFAVYEYDQNNHKDLVFQNVTEGAYKDVKEGTQYWLVITVRDNDSTLNPNPVYQAIVFRRPWDRFKKLLSFVQISN